MQILHLIIKIILESHGGHWLEQTVDLQGLRKVPADRLHQISMAARPHGGLVVCLYWICTHWKYKVSLGALVHWCLT